MATGDITDVTILDAAAAGLGNDGYFAQFTIEGFTTGKQVDCGSGYNLELTEADKASAKIVFHVTSKGFDGTGAAVAVPRTVRCRYIMRKPSPNQAQKNEPSATTVLVALDDLVYAKDKSGVGNSGTDITVDIAAGAFRNNGGASELSNAVTGMAVTNNSTLAYAQPIAFWDYFAGNCTRDRVKTQIVLAVDAYHLFGIACVKLDLDGLTSGHNKTQTITTRTLTLRPASGFYSSAYQYAWTDLSAFTQTEIITGRFIAYPLVGDVPLDSNDHTTESEEVAGWNQARFLCDKDDALDVIKYCSPTGSDSAAGTSGAPYLNPGKAVSAGANIIRLKAGTYPPSGFSHSRVAGDEWIIIEPDAGESSATVTIDVKTTVKTYDCQWMKFKGEKFTMSVDANLDGELVNHLFFEDVDWATPTVVGGLPLNHKTLSTRFKNCTGNLQAWTLNSFSSPNMNPFQIDGCKGDPATAGNMATGAHWDVCFRYTACDYWKMRIDHAASGVVAPRQGPLQSIYSFSRIMKFSNSSPGVGPISVGTTETVVNGCAQIGLVVERTAGPTGNLNFGLNRHVNHLIVWHCSIMGTQVALCMSNSGSSSHNYTNCSVVGFVTSGAMDIETDITTTPNGARTGNWPVLYGIRCYANCMDYQQSEEQSSGYNSAIVPRTAAPSFVDDQSTTGGSAGDGDYRPASGSVQLNRVPAGMRVLTHDLYGKPIADDGTASAGALQLWPPDVSYTTPQELTENVGPVSILPTNAGGPVSASGYSIVAGTLPAGLGPIDPDTGEIAGTPTTAVIGQVVTIEALNDDGVSTFDLTFNVAADPPLAGGDDSNLCLVGVL